MKSKIIFIILLISLAFNVGFVIKYVHKVCARPKNKITHVEKRNVRTKEFKPNETVMVARNENMQLKMQFFSELTNPEPNSETIAEIMEKLEETQRVLERSVLEHFITLRESMEPEEAKVFFDRFQNRFDNRNEKFIHKQKTRREK